MKPRAPGNPEQTITAPGDDAPATTVPPPTRATGPGAPASSWSYSFPPGTLIEHYEIIRELGHGAMGRVYCARDTKLGRRVAIKFVMSGSTRFTHRFLREARATARCQHENIVVVHAVDEYGGLPYLVLEYLEGPSLAKVIRGRTLPPARCVELVTPVVRALVHAHDFGIVHRDLKPANIVVTNGGSVKVLDFGIAKLMDTHDEDAPALADEGSPLGAVLTNEGGIVGTPPYMSPEQWDGTDIDGRSDIWAVGIAMWEMLAGSRPIQADSLAEYRALATAGSPLPSIATVADVPRALADVVDRCLARDRDDRFATAGQLLEALTACVAASPRAAPVSDEPPYPGLFAFQEGDSHLFFGRQRDVGRVTKLIRERPLVCVTGPSGAGKSSFVGAGLIPALKRSGDPWESFVVRPGRRPVEALAAGLVAVRDTLTEGRTAAEDDAETVARFMAEPGYLGTLLRRYAREQGSNVLLVIDQLEEIHTVGDEAQRAAFTALLSGAADDPVAPIRVVCTLRSDFLDRLAEDRRFLDSVSEGLWFLTPLDRRGLREALVSPARLMGYELESDVVDDMLDSLESTSGALPLLQFTAAQLWEGRDRDQRRLTKASYDASGGVAGTLSHYADEVMETLSSDAQGLARSIFLRLVTPERTRAIVELDELRALAVGREGELDAVLDQLVRARLVVSQSRSHADRPALEIVHESLIAQWDRLRSWLDDSHEDAVFIALVHSTARQWDERGRPSGLLWRGDAMEDARHFKRRFRGELPSLEAAYLSEVFDLADRAARRKRLAVGGIIGVLTAIVIAGAAAWVSVRNAEREAGRQADIADTAVERASTAEETARDRERARALAEQRASEAGKKVELSESELRDALGRAEAQAAEAERSSRRAEQSAQRARESEARARELAESERRYREQAETALEEEKARVKKLEAERKKIITELN